MEKTKEKSEIEGDNKSFKDGSICGFDSLHDLLSSNLQPHVFKEVSRLLLGLNCGTGLGQISVAKSAETLSSEHDFDLQAYSFSADKEQLREPRVVRVGLIQNSIALPTTEPFLDQNRAIFQKLEPLINAAGASGVNILCLHEAWTMPFAFCTREKRWCEFAEPVDGESTQFLQKFAQKYNMVIARNAAIANSYFVGSINRVGTEIFPNPFTFGDGKPQHSDFGHFYFLKLNNDKERKLILGDLALLKLCGMIDHEMMRMEVKRTTMRIMRNKGMMRMKRVMMMIMRFEWRSMHFYNVFC